MPIEPPRILLRKVERGVKAVTRMESASVGGGPGGWGGWRGRGTRRVPQGAERLGGELKKISAFVVACGASATGETNAEIFFSSPTKARKFPATWPFLPFLPEPSRSGRSRDNRPRVYTIYIRYICIYIERERDIFSDPPALMNALMNARPRALMDRRQRRPRARPHGRPHGHP